MVRRTNKKLSGKSGGIRDRDRSRTWQSQPYILRKKTCRFCSDENLKIDYLDYQFLRKFTTERGKILPSRISGICAKHQRKLAKAIKRDRNIGLLPYVAE